MLTRYKNFMNWFSTTPIGSKIARTVVARADPFLYRISKGRLVSTGPPTIPQLLLTTTGRKSGLEREVQLGYTPDGDDYLVVASNFGQKHHPAWSYNLDAKAECTVLLDGRSFRARAEKLSDDDKQRVWPRLVQSVPQYDVYVTRTDRNIKVYRLVAERD